MSGEIVFVRCRLEPGNTPGCVVYRVMVAGCSSWSATCPIGAARTTRMLPMTPDLMPANGTGGFVAARLLYRNEGTGKSKVELPGGWTAIIPNWIIGRRKGRHEPEDAA